MCFTEVSITDKYKRILIIGVLLFFILLFISFLFILLLLLLFSIFFFNQFVENNTNLFSGCNNYKVLHELTRGRGSNCR